MRVTRIVLHEVVVSAREGSVNSERYGPAEWDTVPKIVIELETDEGITGLSETPRGATMDDAHRELAAAFGGRDVEALCWQEPGATDKSGHAKLIKDDPDRLSHLHERTSNHYMRVYLQVAWLDLMGKKAGLSASALLGGAYRDAVRVDYWMGSMTPEDSARVSREAKRLGYRGIKCKCALGEDNVARAQAVRDACGSDFKITFDPNYRFYRFGDAIGMLKDLAAVGNIGCVEDPFLPGDLDGYRMLRRLGLFPVALHNSLSDTARVIEAIRAEAVDYMNLSLWPTDTRKAGDACFGASIPTWHGSGMELGILEAAYLHTAAATKSMTRPSDFCGRTVRRHNLITDELRAVDGFVTVPSGPGLGVALDRAALDQFTVRKADHEIR